MFMESDAELPARPGLSGMGFVPGSTAPHASALPSRTVDGGGRAGLLRHLKARARDAVVLSMAIAAIDCLRALPVLQDRVVLFPRLPIEIFLHALPEALVMIFAITLALEARARARGVRRFLLVAAALAGALVLVGAWRALATVHASLAIDFVVASPEAHFVYVLWKWTMLGPALAIFYLLKEREAALARHARDAELRRLRAQRTVMQAQLEVIQARVEPGFLFDALEGIGILYRTAPEAGDDAIDDLITYLRSALPQMRGGLSTITREIELARAWAGVLGNRREQGFKVEATVRSSLLDAPIPPMILLPLVQALLAPQALASRRSLSLRAQPDGGAASIVVAVSGGAAPASWATGGPEAPSATLAACFADAASLRVGSEGDRHWAEVRLPLDGLGAPSARAPSRASA